jgi:hypothetical protein
MKIIKFRIMNMNVMDLFYTKNAKVVHHKLVKKILIFLNLFN